MASSVEPAIAELLCQASRGFVHLFLRDQALGHAEPSGIGQDEIRILLRDSAETGDRLVVFLLLLMVQTVVIMAILGELAFRPALGNVEGVAAEGVGDVVAPGHMVQAIDRTPFGVIFVRPAQSDGNRRRGQD